MTLNHQVQGSTPCQLKCELFIVYNIGKAKVKVKSANYKDKADVTILFIGESEAGKDTVIELIKTRKFLQKYQKTPAFNTITATIDYNAILNNIVKTKLDIKETNNHINYKDKIKIKIINTSGSENMLADVENAKKISHDIRCYIFNAKDFYNVENVKLGIQNTIDECEEKKIKYMSLGTRGDEVDKEKIENEVRSMGMKCSIFELKKEPVEQVIEFLFKEYL